MFDFKVIKKVEIPTISEDVLKQMLIEAIAKKLPADVQVNDVTFAVTRKGGQSINLDVDAQFVDAPRTEPAKEKLVAKADPIELPEADDVPTESEPEVSRDGVPAPELSFEDTESQLIDEVLAEEEEEAPFETEAEPEDKSADTGGKSLSELFNM